ELQVLQQGGDASAVAVQVRRALDGRQLRLFGQNVYSLADRRPMQVEIVSRVPGADGALLPASEIMPVVSQLGLVRQRDELVVEAVMGELGNALEPRAVAVNLSARSLAQGDFIDWLSAVLERAPGAALRLAFELSEHGILHDEAAAAKLAAAL